MDVQHITNCLTNEHEDPKQSESAKEEFGKTETLMREMNE